MLRKTPSFVVASLCLALLLLGGLQTASRADSLDVSAVSGPSGIANLYTVGTGVSTLSSVSGWIYLGTTDGAWFNGNFSQVKTTLILNGKQVNAVALGYLYDTYPCIAYITFKKYTSGFATISARIVDYWSGQIWESAAQGRIISGSLVVN